MEATVAKTTTVDDRSAEDEVLLPAVFMNLDTQAELLHLVLDIWMCRKATLYERAASERVFVSPAPIEGINLLLTWLNWQEII